MKTKEHLSGIKTKNDNNVFKFFNTILGIFSLLVGSLLTYALYSSLSFLIKFPSVYDPRDGAGIIFILLLIPITFFYFWSFYKTAFKQKPLWSLFSFVLIIPTIILLIYMVLLIPVGEKDQVVFAQRCEALNKEPITLEKVLDLNGFCGKIEHYPQWRAHTCTSAEFEKPLKMFDSCVRNLSPQQREALNSMKYGENSVDQRAFFECVNHHGSDQDNRLSKPSHIGFSVLQFDKHGSQVMCFLTPTDSGYKAEVEYFPD